ncbi:MAG: ABC transporter ATP-binding protein [Deltaproteobacteria bacterium]|jgi:putative ABC transport system ATP-binding protein|nr:ABC transporter ATP-binding protein [Deltaproteobacteria bacterium]
MNIITAKNLTKIYARGVEKVFALNDASFVIKKGEILSITGASGSGKTTLVNILGCLDNPTSGVLTVAEQQVFGEQKELSEAALTLIRRQYFGYVFQKFFLIPTLTVQENIMLPSIFQKNLQTNLQNLQPTLEILGLTQRARHLPAELSGGEMQRVAIARALINKPQVLLADEPTGNLDSKRSDEIKNLLVTLNREQGITIILVTHNPDLAKIGSSAIELLDGKILKKSC